MRIENMHSGRGLAGTLLRAGLDALAARGCDRSKVSHELANAAAERAYLGAGFRFALFSNGTSEFMRRARRCPSSTDESAVPAES
jgi:hypothetical protein